jgi:hypothetical protein
MVHQRALNIENAILQNTHQMRFKDKQTHVNSKYKYI